MHAKARNTHASARVVAGLTDANGPLPATAAATTLPPTTRFATEAPATPRRRPIHTSTGNGVSSSGRATAGARAHATQTTAAVRSSNAKATTASLDRRRNRHDEATVQTRTIGAASTVPRAWASQVAPNSTRRPAVPAPASGIMRSTRSPAVAKAAPTIDATTAPSAISSTASRSRPRRTSAPATARISHAPTSPSSAVPTAIRTAASGEKPEAQVAASTPIRAPGHNPRPHRSIDPRAMPAGNQTSTARQVGISTSSPERAAAAQASASRAAPARPRHPAGPRAVGSRRQANPGASVKGSVAMSPRLRSCPAQLRRAAPPETLASGPLHPRKPRVVARVVRIARGAERRMECLGLVRVGDSRRQVGAAPEPLPSLLPACVAPGVVLGHRTSDVCAGSSCSSYETSKHPPDSWKPFRVSLRTLLWKRKTPAAAGATRAQR